MGRQRKISLLEAVTLLVSLLALAQGCEPAELSGGCAGGQLNCEGYCIAVETDDVNCGACGLSCQAGEYCSEGACEIFCGAGRELCGERCLGVRSDKVNCGACDLACDAGLYCDRGSCSATCSGVLCPGAEGELACAHVADDPDHCGACGQACGAGEECQEGVCTAACPPGRLSCGRDCVDPKSSASHCGVCGNSCAAGVACIGGSCEGTIACVGEDCPCPSGQLRCGGVCLDVSKNPFHCGKCDTSCPSVQLCSEGSCSCPDGGVLCSGVCVDERTDSANCGECGNTCAGGKACAAGACTCPDGLEDCGGQCVNLEASPQNCGGCGVTCVGKEICDEGVCFFDVGDDCGGAVRGIDITKVSLFQAVEAVLSEGGEVVPSSARAVDVIAGKAALVRVHVDALDGFVPRVLSARLYLDNGAVDPDIVLQKKTISADSTQASLDSTFNIQVPAELIGVDTSFFVELVECGGTPSGSAGVSRVPAQATAALGARQTGLVRVAFLPIRYNNIVPDTSQAAIKGYADEVLKQFGATSVQTSVLPEYGNYSGTVNLSSLLDDVRLKRAADRPAPEVYYYGLVKSHTTFSAYCQGGCTTGVAYLPNNNANFRAGVGIGYADARSAGTFAHELGHNHNRNHAPCGNPGGPDANYPYTGGRIGKWGYDSIAAQLKNPENFTDLMGYCNPTWVSDYNYKAMTNVIANVNGSTMARREEGPIQQWQALSVTEQGVEWSHPVEMSAPEPSRADTEAAVYDAAGDVLDRVRAYRYERSEGYGYLLLVPPRQPGWYAVGLPGDVAAVYR